MNLPRAPHDFQVRGLLLLGIQHLSCAVGLEKTYEQLVFQVFLRPVSSIRCQIHQILAFHLDASVLDVWTLRRMRDDFSSLSVCGLDADIPQFVGLTTWQIEGCRERPSATPVSRIIE